jgi:hypothetical protein
MDNEILIYNRSKKLNTATLIKNQNY